MRGSWIIAQLQHESLCDLCWKGVIRQCSSGHPLSPVRSIHIAWWVVPNYFLMEVNVHIHNTIVMGIRNIHLELNINVDISWVQCVNIKNNINKVYIQMFAIVERKQKITQLCGVTNFDIFESSPCLKLSKWTHRDCFLGVVRCIQNLDDWHFKQLEH